LRIGVLPASASRFSATLRKKLALGDRAASP